MSFLGASDFVASAIVFVVLLAVAARFIYTRNYGSMVQVSEKKEITTFTNVGASLTYHNIVKATEDFSSRTRIVGGAFGATYKAEVSPGVTVAVTRCETVIGVQQIHAEIKILGTIQHRNLATLIGYHASETEMILIYDYLPGGNLETFIQEKSTRPLCWKTLHKIALDVAHALAYLHEARIVHRGLKPSNILLDDDLNAYLCGFGLYWLLDDSERDAFEGSLGYLAPECAMTYRVSEKVDVYSYGVVLLELISDKRALGASFSAHGGDFNIVPWARMLLRQGKG